MECGALSTVLGCHALLKWELGPDFSQDLFVGHTSCNPGTAGPPQSELEGPGSIHAGKDMVTF